MGGSVAKFTGAGLVQEILMATGKKIQFTDKGCFSKKTCCYFKVNFLSKRLPDKATGMNTAMAQSNQNIIAVITGYGRRLFGFIRGRVSNDEDAEDILQEVWYQLSSQARMEDIESISGWLFRVAKNKITDTYRKKKTAHLDTTGETEDNEEGHLQLFANVKGQDPESQQMSKFFRDTLLDALQELPDDQRKVFIQNEMEDMTLQEIADQEGENIKTVISRKRYAVRYLRSRLEFLYNEFIND